MIPIKYYRNNMIFFHFYILPLYELSIKKSESGGKIKHYF